MIKNAFVSVKNSLRDRSNTGTQLYKVLKNKGK